MKKEYISIRIIKTGLKCDQSNTDAISKQSIVLLLYVV